MASSDGSRTGPRVVVVVPTLGAPHVVRAVQSALQQTYRDVAVVVSVDGPAPGELAAALPDEPRLRIIESDRRRGPRAARAAAIDAAAGADYIAFLDDDDRWHPEKIRRQVAAAEAAKAELAGNVVVLCRMNLVDSDGRFIQTVPRRVLRPGERLADYLFVRREIRPGETTVAASMMLLSRDAAQRARATSATHLHEDWETLLLLAADPSTAVLMLDQVLLDYTVAAAGDSASSRAGWRLSRDWFEGQRAGLTPREHGDGLLCVTGVLAVAQRDWRGAGRIARSVLAERSAGWRAWVFFLASVMLPARLRRALTRGAAALRRVSSRRR
ncbi:MAG TPA: glycosyltransferase family 2 protein [Mycobacteriales bacterium]|nr:glycosyltransferase family 2 protein [Mycobacteriales bacterium]